MTSKYGKIAPHLASTSVLNLNRLEVNLIEQSVPESSISSGAAILGRWTLAPQAYFEFKVNVRKLCKSLLGKQAFKFPSVEFYMLVSLPSTRSSYTLPT